MIDTDVGQSDTFKPKSTNQKGAVTRALQVEDNPSDAKLVRELLDEDRPGGFELDSVARLEEAKARLSASRETGYHVILLDLGLPDSQGMQTLGAMLEITRSIPIVVLTGLDDEQLGRDAVVKGE